MIQILPVLQNLQHSCRVPYAISASDLNVIRGGLERFPIARSAGLSAPRTRPSKGPRYTETETALAIATKSLPKRRLAAVTRSAAGHSNHARQRREAGPSPRGHERTPCCADHRRTLRR